MDFAEEIIYLIVENPTNVICAKLKIIWT